MPNQPVKILIADDEPVIRGLISTVMTKTFGGVSITEASNGTEALAALRTETFDLFISDDSMGAGPRGIDVIRTARAEGQTLTILLSSGTAHLEEAEAAGADGFLPKPYPVSELIKAVADARTVNTQTRRPPMPGAQTPPGHPTLEP